MLTPAVFVAWAPGPVVSMDDHAGRRRIVVHGRRMPAIAIAVADDACRGGCCRQGQGARSDERAERDLAQCFHIWPPFSFRRELTEDEARGSWSRPVHI